MADRKSLFSRFWPPSSSRRTSTTQTAAATATSVPRAQTKTPKASSSPPAPTTPPRTQPRKADQPSSASPEPSKSPSGEVQKASQQTTTPSTDSKDEPKTSSPSPSRAPTRSPSSSKPASPSRLPAQSRAPPQPSSPSRVAPTRPSKPLSPSRATSRSPKQGKLPASPSKGSTQPTETISTSYEAPTLALKERGPKPAAPQQEPEMKEEVKPDSTKVVNGLTREPKPSQLSELGTAATSAQGPETGEAIKSLDSSSGDGGHEPGSHAKPEEAKDVKEVVQATNTEANEEAKKEVDDSSAPKSVSEADQIQREKQEAIDTKEISSTPADPTASQPAKRNKTHGAHHKPNGEQVPLRKTIKADMSEFANQMGMGDPKNVISDTPVSVITLAGENRGASMQMESDSSKREKPVHIHRSYKINPDESPEATTTDAEESSEGKKLGDERSMEDQLMEAYVNNNAQGVNNSIVFNSSIIEGNPGVHMVVNHLPKEPVHSKDKTSCPETRKAEVNMSRAEKLTYQPTVRRRCLRGLLLETSDSDPEKPRRHGCLVACQKGDRENNIDVL